MLKILKIFLQPLKENRLGTCIYSVNLTTSYAMMPLSQSCPRNQHSTQTEKSAFQYSINANNLLTRDQREFYETNGYLLIPKLIEDKVLDQCRDRFIALCEGRLDKGGITLMKDVSLAKLGTVKGEFLYNKAQEIAFDEVFEKYIMHKKLLDYVESFIGPNLRAIHSMLINKPPDAGSQTSRHPLHQDLHYFPHRPVDRIVAAWTAMEPVTQDNGCLFVLGGSHRNPGRLLQHDYPDWEGGVNAMYHGIRGFDSHEKLNLCMQPGDTVFFHPLLIHGSGTNVTKGFRKAISCHYASADCHYIDVTGTSQENIAREVEQIAEKKYGIKTKFQDIWEMKTRLVRGTGPMTSKL